MRCAWANDSSATVLHGLPGRSAATAVAAFSNASSGPWRIMVARSMACADSNDAAPFAGASSKVERSTTSAMRSAASGRPLRAWTRAAPKASVGLRSKALSSKAANHWLRRSP